MDTAISAVAGATPSSSELRVLRKQQKEQRTSEVLVLLREVIRLAESHTFRPLPHYNKNRKAQKNLDATINKFHCHREEINTFIRVLDGTFQHEIPVRTEKEAQHRIAFHSRKYNFCANWLNTWSVNLSKSSDKTMTEFERFIQGKAFPFYDKIKGFESDEDAQKRCDKIAHPELPEITTYTGDSIDLKDEPHYSSDYHVIRSSGHHTVHATVDVADFKFCIQYGIEHAEIESRTFDKKVAKNLHPRIFQPLGKFADFSLALKFGEDFVNSSCEHLVNQVRMIEWSEEYQRLCQRKITHLLRLNPSSLLKENQKLVFCEHPGCTDNDGFIFTMSNFSVPVCLSGHRFCLQCLKPHHSGFCVDEDEERRKLLTKDQKLCPWCKVIINKNGGCNHMTCTHCNNHFCWLCLRTFTRSEQWVHHDGCQQFTHDDEV
jgi:hypothetical protein